MSEDDLCYSAPLTPAFYRRDLGHPRWPHQEDHRRRRSLTTLEKCLIACLLLCAAVIFSLAYVVAVSNVARSPAIENDTRSNGKSDSTPSPGEKSTVITTEAPPENLEDALASQWVEKIRHVERDFARRYPRDQYRAGATSTNRMLANLPRPLKMDSEGNLTNSEKIGEILYSLDDDSDGSADPWELHDWIVWVERAVHRHILDEQWGNFRQVVVGGGLAWGDYLSMVDPEQSPSHDMKRRIERDLRRWEHADSDENGILTKHEFKFFLFPQISPDGTGATVLVPEALEDLDKDGDDAVSLEEFLAVHDEASKPGAEKYFNSTLDSDGDGLVDVAGLAAWVKPAGFVEAKSEVVFLMKELDSDGDKVLSAEEIMEGDGGRLFLEESRATYVGKIYALKDLRREVFQLNQHYSDVAEAT